jgi:hypothetical protein
MLNLVLPGIRPLIILMSRILNLILSHQPKAEVEKVLSWWSNFAPPENILLAYGGREEEFNKLPGVSRVFVNDPRLRLQHGRGKQSWAGVLYAAARWLEANGSRSFTHMYIAEFDHLPLVDDLAARLLGRLEREQADVLGHGLRRVDGTSQVHYLYHLSDPKFSSFWRHISVRSDKQVVLHMLITGSFWSRQAFMKVALQPQEISAYVEIYVATLAHHLGFRVRDFRDQNRCVSTAPLPELSIESARRQGCWTVHPIKTAPETQSGFSAGSPRRNAVERDMSIDVGKTQLVI